MPTTPTYDSSSTHPMHPTSPTSGISTLGSEDEVSAAVWKQRYLTLQEKMSGQKSSKRKLQNITSTNSLGRGIRKLIFISGEIKDLVSDSDKHCTYLEDPGDEGLSIEFEGLDEDEWLTQLASSWERSYTAVQELTRLIPKFQKKIDESSPEELDEFYTALQRGANGARSDDLSRVRANVANWLNAANPHSSTLLDPNCRKNRGINHDITGRLLCPAEFDWDNLAIRAKIRALDQEFDWLSSHHSRCFYAKFKPDATQLESGYLKSMLLVNVFKSIFTSPSSVRCLSDDESDAENAPPTKTRKTLSNKTIRRNIASRLNLNKATPRSIAYAAVQLHFNLQTAASWTPIYGGFDYQGLYNYVVDFFENTPGPASRKRAQELLDWWTVKVFPAAAQRRQTNTLAACKALNAQRAALEREASSFGEPF